MTNEIYYAITTTKTNQIELIRIDKENKITVLSTHSPYNIMQVMKTLQDLNS